MVKVLDIFFVKSTDRDFVDKDLSTVEGFLFKDLSSVEGFSVEGFLFKDLSSVKDFSTVKGFVKSTNTDFVVPSIYYANRYYYVILKRYKHYSIII